MARRANAALLVLVLAAPAWATTDTRNPTGDVAETDSWSGASAGTRYTVVDDHPDSANADRARCVTNGGATLTLSFSAFSVPGTATVNSVATPYYLAEASGGTSGGTVCLLVDSVEYCGTTRDPTTTAALFTETWATNPCSAAAWTPAQVNGSAGSCNLQSVRLKGTDCAPDVDYASVQVVADYTPAAAVRNRIVD